ncbi:glycosyltransferase [Halalkaliarchaeum desulfuricum]|uniref:glycosyltransferase n=1 Tax=Halalkaliarchaeum desulfuricum TaxID=2055893 RepID=UPI00137A9620|nr:glycosyltransferase [Halalkaliarchaeum desulfuricum]
MVIPTYERPEFLRGAIETALGQTHNDLDIVVVDDGSSEQYAEEIVAEFPEIVRCVRHKENKGLSAARNTGVSESSSEYIAFLDDDDRWHREKIARQVDALERNDTAGIATCLVGAITPNNELIHCEQSAPSGDCSETILVGNQIGTPSRVLVRRDAFKDVGGFDESLPTKQDWDFYIRLCQQWTVAAVPEHLCFRMVHQSMSSSPESAKRDNAAILDKHAALLRKQDRWEKAQAEVAERVGRAYLRNGKQPSAREQFERSLRFDPTIQRAVLYLLTVTPPAVVKKLRKIKRQRSIRKSGCDDMLTTDEVKFTDEKDII